MFKFFKKYRLQFDMLAFIVFAVGSYLNFHDYFTLEYDDSKRRGMDLFGGIICGIMAIVKLEDIIGSLKKKAE